MPSKDARLLFPGLGACLLGNVCDLDCKSAPQSSAIELEILVVGNRHKFDSVKMTPYVSYSQN